MAEREPGISLSCALFIECRFHVKREQARCTWLRWLVLAGRFLYAPTRSGYTAGADAAVARLMCLLSSRVGRETETGSRNLLLFGLQSRGCTTAVSVLEACSDPVPWQRRESDRMSRELRFHVKRIANRVRPRAREDEMGKECVNSAYVDCIVRQGLLGTRIQTAKNLWTLVLALRTTRRNRMTWCCLRLVRTLACARYLGGFT